jgi:FlgD Ig-like domain/CARDB
MSRPTLCIKKSAAVMIGLVILACPLLPTTAAAQDVNLTFSERAGWFAPVVPKGSSTATMTSCPLDLYRISTAQFYWNAHGENTGSQSTPGGFDVTVYLDGQWKGLAYAPATAGEFAVINQGPISADLCGRHTVSCYVDALHSVNETDETDNVWGGQYIWDFIPLYADGASVDHIAPPARTGGWDHIVDGTTPLENCDGYLTTNGSLEWQAIVVTSLDPAVDYDTRLYQADSNDNTGGFHTLRATSNRGAGQLDVLFLNCDHDPFFSQNYNIAVVNPDDNDADYRITRRLGYPLELDTPYGFTLEAGEYLDLWGIMLEAADQGPVSVVLETDADSGLRLVRLNPRSVGWWYWAGSLTTVAVNIGLDESGTAFLNWEITDDREHAVAIYREPTAAGGSVSGTIRLVSATPELAFQEAAWWSPLVPSDEVMTDNPVFLPDSLPGNEDTTYPNYLMGNEGLAATGTFSNRLYLDGTLLHDVLYLGGITAETTRPYWQQYPEEVRGGRHTLAVRLDVYDAVDEMNEDNNVYGEQYCWTPRALEYGVPETRPTPPDPTGGQDHLTSGELWYPNCDGLRLSVVDPPRPRSGWWRAMAVMPTGLVDVDVALHPAATDTKDGFTNTLITSTQPLGTGDYVLVNLNTADDAPYDAGVRRDGEGVATYVAEAVYSDLLAWDPDGAYGPLEMPGGHWLQLHEVFFPDWGPMVIRLDDLSGTGVLGLTLHSRLMMFGATGVGQVADGMAQADSPGGSVWLSVDVPVAGYYCLAVWKAETDDLEEDMSYTLRFMPGVTPVPDTPAVSVSRICGAQPNPFNPCTTVIYEVAHREQARVVVYDLQGRLVRVLHDEVTPAGRHEVFWDGADTAGQTMASGVYVVRLTVGHRQSMLRLTMLK